MAAGTWTVFDSAKEYIGDGTIDMDTDTLKVALFTSTAAFTSGSITTYSTANEVAAGNGYAAGGVTVTGATVTYSGSTAKYGAGASTASWTASGGSIVARYAVLYKSGTANGVTNPVIAFVLLDNTPANVTVTAGNVLAIATPTNGFFTMT
jgi:hypothetical protein